MIDPPPLYILDTNCWINAARGSSLEGIAVLQLLHHADTGSIRVALSRHTLHQLEATNEQYDDGAYELAQRYLLIPYYPVGTIDELLGTIGELAGTFDDLRQNHVLQVDLETLAKQGTDLRDRGAVIDALRAGATAFVTSDGQLAKPGPAARIVNAIGLQIVTPEGLERQLAASRIQS